MLHKILSQLTEINWRKLLPWGMPPTFIPC